MDTIKREDLIRAVKILGYDPQAVETLQITKDEVRATLIDFDSRYVSDPNTPVQSAPCPS